MTTTTISIRRSPRDAGLADRFAIWLGIALVKWASAHGAASLDYDHHTAALATEQSRAARELAATRLTTLR
jgi:hypothetical protein